MTIRFNQRVKTKNDPSKRPRPCIVCGEIFEPIRDNKRFCGKVSCDKRYIVQQRKKNHLCLQCGKVKVFRNKCERCMEYDRMKHKEHLGNKRRKIISAYGGMCVCCGEDEAIFLTIDHIFNDGAKHRAELFGYNKSRIGGVVKFYNFLIANNFPKDRFQILCYNCNCAKGRVGYCPHRGR